MSKSEDIERLRRLEAHYRYCGKTQEANACYEAQSATGTELYRIMFGINSGQQPSSAILNHNDSNNSRGSK